jgi:hypothetical protein
MLTGDPARTSISAAHEPSVLGLSTKIHAIAINRPEWRTTSAQIVEEPLPGASALDHPSPPMMG